jgi:hypothetical protein
MSLTHRTIALRLLMGVVFSLLALSCKQYEYASPSPGVLEVRLKVLNNRQDIIPFGPQSQFGLLLKELNGILQGAIKQPIYADLQALRRSPDGDQLNALDTLARDSSLILGATYAPPETFAGIDMRLEFSPVVLVTRGVFPNPIEVRPPPPPALPIPTFFQIPEPPQSINITINESRLTRVVLTLDLDASLIRRAEFFEIHPVLYISSVQNY